jgi:hypothetical protein
MNVGPGHWVTHTITKWLDIRLFTDEKEKKGKQQRQNVVQPDGELKRQLDTHPHSDSDYGRLNESLERCWKGSLKCASLFFLFCVDILCVAVCVVFRWDQRAKSTSWAVRRVALPVCLDTIPSKCWEKQTSLPSHLLATWRIHFFGSTVPTLSTLLAESDCTIKGKKKKYEKNLFLLLLFFGGRLANLHRIFF